MERVQREHVWVRAPSAVQRTACGSETRRHCREARRQTQAASDYEGAEATSTPTGPSVLRLRQNPRPPRRQPERAPHSPTSASAAARPSEHAATEADSGATPNGGTHRGGVGTPLEGTYFQAEPGNAICVQSLDDSLNSAIHITYHISLRSSSLREPRYPSTGVVVWVVVSARAHTDPARRSRASTRAVWWGGALQTKQETTPDRRARSPSSQFCV